MEFSEQYLEGIKTPVLVPKTVRLLGVKDNKVNYLDYLDGREKLDEVHLYHAREALVLSSFRKIFPVDEAIVMLFTHAGNLLLQKRGERQKWEPGKLDLASVVGARNAFLKTDKFVNEDWEQTARREVEEETGFSANDLVLTNLKEIGEHYNESTNSYQKVFAAVVGVSVTDLNRRLKVKPSAEVGGWLEQGYEQTMAEYFGDKVEKYAGGAELRELNFISEAKIRGSLDHYFSLVGGQQAKNNKA